MTRLQTCRAARGRRHPRAKQGWAAFRGILGDDVARHRGNDEARGTTPRRAERTGCRVGYRRVSAGLALLICVAAGPLPAHATRVDFDLAGCDYIEAIVRVPAGAVAPLIPSDFTLLSTGGLATVNLGGADCREATSDTETGTAAFGWVLARIERPAAPALRGFGVGIWFYRLEHFVVPGDVYQHVAAAVGADQIPVDVIDASVPAVLSELVIQAGTSAHTVQVPISPPGGGVGTGSAHWREFHAVPGGYAILDARLQPDAQSGSLAGIVQPAEGSVAHDVFGSLNAGQALYGTSFAIENAFMDVLPWP